MTRSIRWRLAAIAVLPAVLAACGVTPTHYYSLADTADTVTRARVPAPSGDTPLFIELAPVAVPERLTRPQMVVRRSARESDTRIEILDRHRWSSSFESELRDAVASGVASRLGAIDASRSGRPGGQGGWRIALQLQQYDAIPGDRIDGRFSWTVRSVGEGPVASCQLALTEAVGPGMDAVAQGAQRMVGRLSDSIARGITSMQSGQAPACSA